MSDLQPMVAPYDPERFQSTVSHYVQHRLQYDPQLLSWMCEEADVDAGSTVLDLGCGPGFIANALSPMAGTVVGVDPSEAMLEAARAAAAAAGLDNVSYKVGSSFDLSIVDGPLQLVTMGRSFHWMDRVATLETLDGLVSETGAIALVGDRVIDAPENAWYKAFNAAARSHSELDDCAKHRYSEDWAPHPSILVRSSFSEVSRISIYRHHTWDQESLYGYARSRSGTAPGKIADDAADRMRSSIAEAVAPYLSNGPLTSLHEHNAILARRP